MARWISLVALVGVILGSGAFVSRLPAQQQTSPQTELLAEVRLLRQAIESLTGVNARVQIVFGRLQLQEQRTAAAMQRYDRAREVTAQTTREISGMADHLKSLENMINDGRRKPDEIEQAQRESAMVARRLEQLEQERLRLLGEETEASSALNQEQGRWSDLNRQLEELERALIKR